MKKSSTAIFVFLFLVASIFADSIKRISPNGDGVEDALIINLKLSANTGKYIDEFGLAVEDQNGKVIFFEAKKFLKKQKNSISWNAIDRNGNVVPAGEYFYWIIVLDENDNIGKTAKAKVIVSE